MYGLSGSKHWAWSCAGGSWMVDSSVPEPLLMLADGECPVLCLPPGLSAEDSERAFGWAIAELLEQQEGWLALLRLATRLVPVAATE